MPESVPTPTPPDITTLLERISAGDADAAHSLLPLVYDHLRTIARGRMSNENAGHTLEATALVHELYLKLVGERQILWQNRAHFYLAAAEGMRRLLIDHARTKRRKKRGGSAIRKPLNVLDLAVQEDSEQILALEEAICRLELQNPEAARVVQLRFFAGLSVDETAAAMDLSPRTVDRRWKFARAWLFKELEGL
ncbi:MAG: sigma-70 family RNA polymerase sigma factor [Pirellulaceae bacterium]